MDQPIGWLRLMGRYRYGPKIVLYVFNILNVTSYGRWNVRHFTGWISNISDFSVSTSRPRYFIYARSAFCPQGTILYTVSQKNGHDMFNYLQQILTNINTFWYREWSFNLLTLTLTILQYVVQQRTSLGFFYWQPEQRLAHRNTPCPKKGSHQTLGSNFVKS